MRTVTTTKSLAAASGNNIAQSQTPGGAGDLTLNGSAVVSGVAILDTQRIVGITSSGNDAARTFVVYGTDENGNAIQESVFPGPNAGTVSTTLNFKTVTRVSIDGAGVGGITVGTTGVGAGSPIILDQYISPFSVSLEADVTGTVNYDVQYTYGNLFNASELTSIIWWSIASLTGQTADKDGSLAAPVQAVRVKINSGSGSVRLKAMQAGLPGNG